MLLWENIKLAIVSIKSNILRSFLTIIIIMVGIAALVGILTAIDTMLYSLNDSFNSIGANSFEIKPKYEKLKFRRHGVKKRTGAVITYRQALLFKKKYAYPGAKVTVFSIFKSGVEIKYKDKKTTPTQIITGIDENYFTVNGIEIAEGRGFNTAELDAGMHKVILGYSIAKTLFGKDVSKAVGKIVDVNGYNYKVTGVTEKQGASKNGTVDNTAFIPLLNGKRYYHYQNKPYNIITGITGAVKMEEAISNAIVVFRKIRKLRIVDENDFEITKSDNILNMIKDATFKIRIYTIAIALLTLLGAAIGLMNIMLVTVSERTREIGIRKAVGATDRHILIQFLTESVIISQLGGILGILAGLVIGMLLAKFLFHSSFVMPWAWILLAVVINTIVGLISGVYPALRASKLDPIESLRHE